MKVELEEKWKYIGFDDKWVSIIGVPAIGFLFPLLFLGGWETSWDIFKVKWIESTLHTAIYWAFMRYLIVFLRKTYPKLEQTGTRLMMQALIFGILGLVLGVIIHVCFVDIFCEKLGLLLVSEAAPVTDTPLLATYFTGFSVFAVYEAKYFYYQLVRSIEEREAAKQAQIRSELEGLRNQVNPHFLFNSMNTLMNLVTADQQVAVSFLKKLSKVYRYVLENRAEQLIPLKKELDFIHSYVFLQEERFKGNLSVDISIPEKYHSYHIIPLSLQILFENAIKHNIISRKKPLCIRVYMEEDMLVIRNKLQRKEQVMDSTKVGLENIRTRYNYFTDKQITVAETEEYFTVKIPIIKTILPS